MPRSGLSRPAILAAMVLAGCAPRAQEATDRTSLAERGKYLTQISGCHDCHSPKVFTEHGPLLDENRLLSGHPQESQLPPMTADDVRPGGWILFNDHLTAAVGPWGVSFAMNLTPDEETGIGVWTEDAFIAAMREGKHMGVGRPILPPIPWLNLAEAKTEDLRAIYAYLQSLPPIRNRVPSPIPPEEVGREQAASSVGAGGSTES